VKSGPPGEVRPNLGGPADVAGPDPTAVAHQWRAELAALAAILVGAAAIRLADLPARGLWDADQGTEMLALRNAVATGRLPLFGPEAISVDSPFHHGALYYDLLLPAAWLGNGDPVWVLAEIAFLSLLVIPAVWWMARTIGGPAAGLIAALLAAVSASLVGYATFIWNPTLVEPAAAVAYLGAWQAVSRRQARWWLVAAGGAAVAMQSHVAAGVILVPLAVALVVDLIRGPRERRASTLRWGLAGGLLLTATYLPVIAYELSHDFAETRAMLAYFAGPDTAPARDPVLRLLFSATRILVWPLTRWPLVDLLPAFGVAVLVAEGMLLGLVWRSVRLAMPRSEGPARPESSLPSASPAFPVRAREGARRLADWASKPGPHERLGTLLVAGWLLLLALLLGLGLRAVSEVQGLPTEQYHVVADPLVFVAAGLIVAAMLRPLRGAEWTSIRRVGGLAMVAALVGWNVAHWPALSAPDGGWPAAQAAASRLEHDAAGSSLALVPLYEPKGAAAYAYPLLRDGATLMPETSASTIVLLCDSFWLTGCGGEAESAWLKAYPGRGALSLIDRFAAAPDRILSVYRSSP
jgi:4-amino-4-deoxy-L-arabinose transferase-like glycosyltransferase